jgi:hypothetical protein
MTRILQTALFLIMVIGTVNTVGASECPVTISIDGPTPLAAANIRPNLISSGFRTVEVMSGKEEGFVVEAYVEGSGEAECVRSWIDDSITPKTRQVGLDKKPLLPVSWRRVAASEDDKGFVIAPGKYRLRISIVGPKADDSKRRTVWTIYSPVFEIVEESHWTRFE